jgi:hypothetical protein
MICRVWIIHEKPTKLDVTGAFLQNLLGEAGELSYVSFDLFIRAVTDMDASVFGGETFRVVMHPGVAVSEFLTFLYKIYIKLLVGITVIIV